MSLIRKVTRWIVLTTGVLLVLSGCGGGDNASPYTQIRFQNLFSNTMTVKSTDSSTNTQIQPGATSSWYDVAPGTHSYSITGPGTILGGSYTIEQGHTLTLQLKPPF